MSELFLFSIRSTTSKHYTLAIEAVGRREGHHKPAAAVVSQHREQFRAAIGADQVHPAISIDVRRHGRATALRQGGEDKSAEWLNRAARIQSQVQIGQPATVTAELSPRIREGVDAVEGL